MQIVQGSVPAQTTYAFLLLILFLAVVLLVMSLATTNGTTLNQLSVENPEDPLDATK